MPAEMGGLRIGAHWPLFVIAELGLNHGGSRERAVQMVDRAADAGASAIKLQTFQADRLVAASCPAPAHVPAGSLREFFRRFELDADAHAAVARRARQRGVAFISTPFSLEAVALLEAIGVDALKIASGDLTYDALIARAARTGLPLILSTGMATLGETAHAVAVAREAGARSLALLHCVSAYPVPDEAQNLRAIQTLARVFGVPVGLSDHAATTAAVPLAVALGASIYERHFMLSGDEGVDAAVSSTPEAFAAIVETARRTEAMLGHGRRECLPQEAVNLAASRRSLHASRRLPAGVRLAADDIAALRPSSGLPTGMAVDLVGSVLTRPVDEGAPFVSRDIALPRSQRGIA